MSQISPEFLAFVKPDGPPYLFMGGSEEEWFKALESGYFAEEYNKQVIHSLSGYDMGVMIIPPPGDDRSINAVFNGGTL